MRTTPAPKQPVRHLTATEAARPAAAPVLPAGQVLEQSNHIDNAINRLEEITRQLRDRLGTVLAERDAKPGEPQPPDATIVPFADTMRQHQRRINGLAANLEDLLGSIEL